MPKANHTHVQLVPVQATGPLPSATGEIEFMIVSGAEFYDVDRVKQICEAGESIKVSCNQPRNQQHRYAGLAHVADLSMLGLHRWCTR